MARRTRTVRPDSTVEANDQKKSEGWEKYFLGLGNVLNRVGLAGFVVLCITVYFFGYAGKDMRTELVNTWLLFRTPNNTCPPSFFYIVGALIALMLMHHHFLRKELKASENRIREIANEKTELQNRLIGSNLGSSKK